MKIDFNVPVRDVKGKPILDPENNEVKVADTLATLLSTEVKGNAVKLKGWAEKLAQEGVLELDKADYETLYKIVDESDRQQVLLRGAALEIMIEAKRDDKKETAQ